MEMRKVLEQEGRDAKNLVAYHLSGNEQRTPIRRLPLTPRSQMSKKNHPSGSTKNGPRVRSASTGRDKKSEFQSRHWALLFRNLQNTINEIYQTVECYENLSSCQEAILVLDNYIRDFKALAEWFKVSWDYEATPLPQRPQSLAWEIRKSNPAPKIRPKSLTSPALSGKSSPSFSGKNSPCPTIDESLSSKSSEHQKEQSSLIQIKEIPEDNENGNKKSVVIDQNENEHQSTTAVEQIEKNIIDSEIINICGPSDSDKDKKEDNTISVEPEAIGKHADPLSDVEPELEIDNEILDEVDFYPLFDKNNDMDCQTELDDGSLTLSEFFSKHNIAHNPQLGPISDTDSENEVVLPKLLTELKEIDELEKKEENVENGESPSKGAPTKLSDIVKKAPPALPLKYSSVLNRSIGVTASSAGGAVHIKNPPKMTIVTRLIVANPVRQQTASKGSQNINTVTKAAVNRQPQFRVTSKPVPNVIAKPEFKPNNNAKINNINRNKTDNWVPSNVANRLSARSKTMIDMNSKKHQNNQFIPKNNLKTKRPSIDSSTSTLIASNEKLARDKQFTPSKRNHPDSRRSEPKSFPSDAANDGWLTVKTRRRSSLHWANRFNQPTGYASLPTLSLLNESDSDNERDEIVEKEEKNEKNEKKKIEEEKKMAKFAPKKPVAASKEIKVKPGLITRAVPEKPTIIKERKINAAPTQKSSSLRESIVMRQKSDTTGLKLKALRKEYLKSEQSLLNKKPKLIDSKLVETRIKEKPKDEDKENEPAQEKVDMNFQTNPIFSQTMNDLYSQCQNDISADDDDKIDLNSTVTNNTLSSCDELEERDAENDENQRKLLEEQESLERQIRELQNAEIDVDTETDETDCEVTIDLEDSIGDSETNDSDILETDENISLEMRYQSFLSDMSIGERVATLATLEALVARHPGRAQELHQKLSSPSRRRSLHETLKKYQAKQARAQEKRELLQREKASKIQQLLTRVEDVKAAKQQLIEEKRLRMEERLQRAAENRSQYLKDKVRKAHDEEEKLREIAFIKNLEAQNKRLDFIESCKEHEVRLQDLEQERQKKVEEKAAKDAAVERRRLELEKERQQKLEKMRETRKEREQRMSKMQEQKEKARQAIAREKARDREERLQARQAAEIATTQELQRKIIQKQQESARRHEENIEHIRQRAVELSIPSRNVDENGQRVGSTDRGENPSDLSSTVSDLSREVSKNAKKKLKKLKQRMSLKADEYLNELQELPGYIRKESQVPKLLNTIVKGGGPQGIERPLGQLNRIVVKAQLNDFHCIWLLNGLETITDVIKSGMELNSEISKRAVLLAVQLYRNSCSLCPQIARHAVLGNSVAVLLESLLISLQSPEEKTPLHPVELSTELILACTVVLSPTNSLKAHPKVMERLPDIISYSVMIGLIDVLTLRCKKIREPIENHQSVVLSILATLGLLTKFAEICPLAGCNNNNDPTKFLTNIRNTDLFGSVTLLYSTIVPIGECLPPRTISLAAAILNLLVSLATLDINTFQDVLSEESTLLKFLDVASILLKYCGPKSAEKGETRAVIIDLIATVGYICANRKSNQDVLTSEQYSSIIKSLSKLPKDFNIAIYPALVTIMHNNDEAKRGLSKDFDVELIEEYKKSEMAKKNRLVSILKT